MTSPQVLVIGSLHSDLIARAEALPAPGTSVIGDSFTLEPGGKAANQAAQLALLGVSTLLVSRIGADTFGDAILTAVRGVGVDTSHVAVDPRLPTGASAVFAARDDYSSIIVPGAAARFRADELDRACQTVQRAHFVIGQLEISAAATTAVFRAARKAGVRTVLNASPLDSSTLAAARGLLAHCDIVIVNRAEASILLQTSPDALTDLSLTAESVRTSTGVPAAVVTAGAHGAAIAGDTGVAFQAAIPSPVVDTVGAGDAFLGALVAGLLDGKPNAQALREGVAAGALAVRSGGAFPSLPDRTAIDRLLAG